MQNLNSADGRNPIAELINDDVYTLLTSRGLIDENRTRLSDQKEIQRPKSKKINQQCY